MVEGHKSCLVINDDQSAFLEVELQDIRALSLSYDLSSTSFMDAKYAYLNMENENPNQNGLSDAELFLLAQSNTGVHVEIELRQDVERLRQITASAGYLPYFVDNPLDIGGQVQLTDGRLAEVTGIGLEEDILCVQIETLASDPEFFSFPFAAIVEHVQMPELENKANENGQGSKPGPDSSTLSDLP